MSRDDPKWLFTRWCPISGIASFIFMPASMLINLVPPYNAYIDCLHRLYVSWCHLIRFSGRTINMFIGYAWQGTMSYEKEQVQRGLMSCLYNSNKLEADDGGARWDKVGRICECIQNERDRRMVSSWCMILNGRKGSNRVEQAFRPRWHRSSLIGALIWWGALAQFVIKANACWTKIAV